MPLCITIHWLMLFNLTALIRTSRQYEKYEDIKDLIGFIPYTPTERVEIAKSIRNTFSVNVNIQSKIDHYSQASLFDPISKIDSIIKQAAKLSDKVFHYKFIDIFTSLCDFHTVYQLPGPHGCVVVHRVIKFDVANHNDDQSIIVSDIDTRLLGLSPSASKVRIGDRLISVSGLDINKYLRLHASRFGGAGKSGALRAGLLYLSRIDGKINRLPKNSVEVFEFQDSEGILYSIDLPWISSTDTQCFDQSQEARQSIGRKEDNWFSSWFSTPPQKVVLGEVNISQATISKSPDHKSISVPLEIASMNNTRYSNRFQNLKFFQTADEGIHWMIYCRKHSNIGVIRLETFSPKSKNVPRAITLLKNLLFNQLRSTSAILIDVRYNPGGMISYADMIPQLFGSKVKIGTFRAIISAINKEIFKDSIGDIWSRLYSRSNPSDKYTLGIHFTEEVVANSYGQAYTNPVGVFTNGECYSSCEIFAANMQDNNIASIFGEDEQTGGGGASVVEYNSLLSKYHRDYFFPFPHAETFPLMAQDMRISFRQFVRIDGSLIEDDGIKSDYVIRPTVADFKPDDLISSQYDRIADILIEKGRESGQSDREIKVYPESLIILEVGDDFSFKIFSKGYTKLLVYDENDTLVDSRMIDSTTPIRTTFTIISKNTRATVTGYRVCAFDASSKALFSTWRSVRIESKRSKELIQNQV